MSTEEERRVVAELLTKRERGIPLTDRERRILAYSRFGDAAACRCKR